MLVEVTADSLNRMDEAEEWEEVDFMVDSGAGTCVIAETDLKAVVSSEPDPTWSYIMADGSSVPDGGHKAFNAYTEDSLLANVSARVTVVNQTPPQCVSGGCGWIRGDFLSQGQLHLQPRGRQYSLRAQAQHLPYQDVGPAHPGAAFLKADPHEVVRPPPRRPFAGHGLSPASTSGGDTEVEVSKPRYASQ